MSEMYWRLWAVGKPHLAHGYLVLSSQCFLMKQDVLVTLLVEYGIQLLFLCHAVPLGNGGFWTIERNLQIGSPRNNGGGFWTPTPCSWWPRRFWQRCNMGELWVFKQWGLWEASKDFCRMFRQFHGTKAITDSFGRCAARVFCVSTVLKLIEMRIPKIQDPW